MTNRIILGLKKRSLFISTISNYVSLLISTVVYLLLIPYLIKLLGESQYGAWALIGSIVGYYGLLDLGVSSAVISYVARFKGQNNEGKIEETINTALAIFVAVAGIVVLASIIISHPLGIFIKIPSTQLNDFRNSIVIMGFTFAITLISSVFYAALRGHENFVVTNLVNVVTSVLKAAFMVIALMIAKGLTSISFACMIAQLINLIMLLYFCRRLLPALRYSIKFIDAKVIKYLLIFGASTTLIEVASILRFNLDSMVIGKILDLSSVAVYSISATILTYYMRSISTFTQTLLPRLSKLDGAGNTAGIEATFFSSMRFASIITFSIAILLFMGCRTFIHYWVGDRFEGAAIVLYILIPGYILSFVQSPSIQLLFSMNKHYIFGIYSIAEGACNLILSILLAKKYGIYGVAMGTLFPMLFFKLAVQPFYVCNATKLSLKKYYWLISKVSLLSAIFIVPALILGNVLFKYSPIIVLFACIVIAFMYIIFAMKCILMKEERELLLSKLSIRGA